MGPIAPYALSLSLWCGVFYAGPSGSPRDVAAAAAVALIPSFALSIWAVRRSEVPADELLGPLAWLCLAAIAWVLPLPYLPIAIAIAVAVGLAVRAARTIRTPLVARRLERLALVLLLLSGMPLLQTTVVHDAFQYQATAVSMLNGDYDLFDELFLYNSHRSYNPYAEGSIRYLGVPLLELPGLTVARWLAPWTGHPPNGFTQPFALAISLTSMAFGMLGLLLIYRWTSNHCGLREGMAATALVLWASPLPFFLYLWHGWTHTYSICFSAAFLLVFDSIRRDHHPTSAPFAGWLGLGLIAGVLALIWPINALILALPALELISRWRSQPGRTSMQALVLGAGSLVGFLPQFAGWYGATGDAFNSTYAKVGDYFDWVNPQLWEMLFSVPRHGLFSWHPLWLIGFAGIFWIPDRRLRFGLGVWVGLQIYVMSCWSVWWTGIGFGNRFFLNLLPAAAIGLAAGLRYAWLDGGLLRRWTFATTAVALVFANLCLLAAYRIDVIPMGIDAPNYLQDESPTLPQLFATILAKAPPTLEAFTRDFWVNQNFFAARLRLAHSAPATWGGSVLLAAGLSLVAASLVFATSRPRIARLGSAAVLAATLASIAACLWLGTGLSRGRSSNEFFHFDMQEEILMPFERVTLVPQGYLRPVRRIDVISFLTYGIPRPQQPVAVLRIRGEGRETRLELRGAVDTDGVALPWLGGERGVPVHEWLTRAGNAQLFEARAYLGRFELAQPLRIESIEIEMLPGAGDLTVRDVFLES